LNNRPAVIEFGLQPQWPERLSLLKRPFSLRQLMLRPTMDTLLNDDVVACVAPPDPPNMGAFARHAPARSAGLAAPTAGVATHSASTVAAREHGAVALLLGKDTPIPRLVMPPGDGDIVAIPEVGGLHHRYERRAA